MNFIEKKIWFLWLTFVVWFEQIFQQLWPFEVMKSIENKAADRDLNWIW